MGKFVDLTGQRFGTIVVLEYAGRNKQGSSLWRCRCDGGEECILQASALRRKQLNNVRCAHKNLVYEVRDDATGDISHLRVKCSNCDDYFLCDVDDWNVAKNFFLA